MCSPSHRGCAEEGRQPRAEEGRRPPPNKWNRAYAQGLVDSDYHRLEARRKSASVGGLVATVSEVFLPTSPAQLGETIQGSAAPFGPRPPHLGGRVWGSKVTYARFQNRLCPMPSPKGWGAGFSAMGRGIPQGDLMRTFLRHTTPNKIRHSARKAQYKLGKYDR